MVFCNKTFIVPDTLEKYELLKMHFYRKNENKRINSVDCKSYSNIKLFAETKRFIPFICRWDKKKVNTFFE